MKIKTALLLAIITLAGTAEAKRPKNPRRFKKNAVMEAVARSTAPASAVAVRNIPRLSPGSWDPAVKFALEEFIADHSSATASYDAQRPPVAVFAWDDAAVRGDAGSIVFQKLVERADFKFDDEFWGLVPLEYGRQRLRAAYEIFSVTPVSTWSDQPEYQQYRKGFFAAYRDMCAKVGRGECRAWLSRLLKGFDEDELRRYAQGAIREEVLRPRKEEEVYAGAQDNFPVRVQRGRAHVPELRELAVFLIRAGFDVWVIDTDNQIILETAAKEYGVDPSRVEGIRLGQAKEKLTSEIVSPIPIRGGKVDIAASMIGRPPQLVIGAKAEDEALLRHSAGLRLALGDQSGLRRVAQENGWLMQPAFMYHP